MAFEMDFLFDEKENLLNVKLSGELDIYSVNDFKNRVLELYTQRKSDIQFDCTKLEYIDSTGLGAMVSILKVLKDDNKSIYLYNLKTSLMKLFKITKLDEIFKFRGENDVQ
ncbi:MAG: STAS domain-containing protein [Tissierellia bacterium]|nr:STAS domain-containing protein [Tissierellia bacterium]